jgi:hypothetical protein
VKTVFATEFATGLQRVGIGASNILKSLARRKGFEPLTPRFEVWCSIQLSYRRPGGTGLPQFVVAANSFPPLPRRRLAHPMSRAPQAPPSGPSNLNLLRL